MSILFKGFLRTALSEMIFKINDYFTAKEEERRPLGLSQTAAPAVTAVPTKTKDDAYDQFMKEMSDLL